MTAKQEITIRQAYSDGLIDALFRKPESANPFLKSSKLLSDAWLNGYKRGRKTVEYHTTVLRTRLGTTWYYKD